MSTEPPPCPATAETPGLDPEILDVEPMVRNFGGLGPTTAMLYGLFLTNADELTIALRSHVDSGNLAGARMAAHAASGAARTVGARRLAWLFSDIEDALLGDDPARVHADVQELSSALANVRSMIARL